MRDDEQNLLEVSQFLTTFQDYFRADDEQLGRNIAPRDVRHAIDYQDLLEEHIRLRYTVSLNSDSGDTAPAESNLKQQLQEKERELQDTSPDIKLIHRILKRFEVWMTKDLAQKVFMMPPSRNEAHGGAPMLNLPSAAYMGLVTTEGAPFPRRRRWKTKSPTPAAKTLLLPPTRWTWQEYLRLSCMVSFLPTPEARRNANQSTITATNVVFQGRKEDLKAAEGVKLSPADLVALWVRAQRNTSAWRHLTQLFVIEKVTRRKEKICIAAAGTSGKKLVVAPQDDEDAVEEDYVANYVGNHSKLSSMIRKDSHPMDSLVEWAVTNQVLFTHKYMVEGIENGSIPKTALNIPSEAYELGPLQPPSSQTETDQVVTEVGQTEEHESTKRPSSGEEGAPPSKKRRKVDVTEKEKLHLLWAKQSFILRWFARRNRKVTSVLFSNEIYDLPIHATLVDTLIEKGVPETVKKILRDRYESADRTFARIDRRIFVGKYNDGLTFQNAVFEVLESLKLATEELSAASIDEVMEDFRQLYMCFLGEEPQQELIDPSVANMVEHLTSVQPPWQTECCVCHGAYKDEKIPVVCSNCEMPMHHECCDGSVRAKKSLQKIAETSEPLSRVFSIRIPLSRDPPDFRNMVGLEWTRLELTVKTDKDCGLRLGIHHTETCKEVLDTLLSERLIVSVLADRNSKLRLSRPLAVEHNGVLVTEIMQVSPAREAGVEEGDIITHVKTEEVSDHIDLSELDSKARIELLKKIKGPTVLVIQRPNKPLLQMSKEWYKDLQKKANKGTKRIFEKETIQTFCKSCISPTPPKGERNAVEEARRCLAVIRRLSMESYSIPFHVSGHSCNDSENHLSFVSLRRLDEMMISIINSTTLSGGGYGWSFSAPPQLNADGSLRSTQPQRLSWVSDQIMNKPFELLCCGMKVLLTPPIALHEGADKDPFTSERSALASHFLSLFVSWCLRSSFDLGCVATMGPKTDYTAIAKPWLGPTCKFCMLSFTPCDETGGSLSCSREACRVVVEGMSGKGHHHEQTAPAVSESEGDDIDHVVEATGTSISSTVQRSPIERVCCYNQYASLVGSVLLILPGDPVLDVPAHFLQQPCLKTGDKPTPFIVASYLPSYFIDVKPGSCIKAADALQRDRFDGVFHLLPVICSRQLLYLQKVSAMRNPPTSSSANKMPRGWANLAILDLPGVVCLTPRQLIRKLVQTKAVGQSISLSVARQASSPCESSCDEKSHKKRVSGSDTHEDTEARLRSSLTSNTRAEAMMSYCGENIRLRPGECDLASKYSTLVESAVVCNSERAQEIMESLIIHEGDVSSPEDQDTDTEEQDNPFEEAEGNSVSNMPPPGIHVGEILELGSEVYKTRDGVTSDGLNQQTANDHGFAVDAVQHATDYMPMDTHGPDHAGMSAIPREGHRKMHPNDSSHRDSTERRNNMSNAENDTNSNHTGGLRQPVNVTGSRGLVRAQEASEQVATDLMETEPIRFTQRQSYNSRMLQNSDLYRAGPEGTCLTRVEAAVVVGVLEKGYPLLARRVLCPRYRWSQADEQIRIIQLMDTSMIPKIQQQILEEIFTLDYDRSGKEQGAIIAREGTFEYRMPEQSLPLDTFVHRRLHYQQPQLHHHHPTQLHQPQLPTMHHHPTQQYQPQLAQTYEHVTSRQAPPVYQHTPVVTAQLPQVPQKRRHSYRSNVSPLARQASQASNLAPTVVAESSNGGTQRGAPVLYTGRHAESSFQSSREVRQRTSPELIDLVAEGHGDNDKENADSSASREKLEQSPPDREDGFSDCPDVTPADNCLPTDAMNGNTQRIRGGGPDHYSPRRLDNLSKCDWGGKLVTAKVETTKKGGTLVEATIIGFTDEQRKDVDEDGSINVDVIFISNHGLLDTASPQPLPLASLYLVDTHSEEEGIANNWREQQGSAELLDDGNLAKSTTTASENAGSTACDPGCDLARRLAHRAMGSCPLGCLPDGRKVFWMTCDPCSLQLRFPGETEQLILTAQASAASATFIDEVARGQAKCTDDQQNLNIDERASHYCFWGCRSGPIDGKMSSLSFGTTDELMEHLETQHKHSSSNGKLFMSSGEQIKSLAADLTAAACARWPPLLQLTTTADSSSDSKVCFHRNLQFDLQRVLAATKSTSEKSLRIIVKDFPGNKRLLRELVCLWSRLARLFDIERNGEPKIDPKDLKGTFPPSCHEVVREEDTEEKIVDYCFDGRVVPKQLQFTQCQLCCADSEECVTRLDGVGAALGCSLISSVGSNQCSPSAYLGHSSLLSMSKSILVHIATALPRLLRQVAEQGSSSTQALPREDMWEDGRFQEWCKFVESCTSSRMLAQALIVLLSSLHRNKLPLWWRSARAGWSKPFVLMTQPTSSGLLLHLYVLDAAVADFLKLSGGGRDDTTPSRSYPIPKTLRTMRTEERMETVVNWAQHIKFPEFDGVHGVRCVRCDDGGDLLCCEYCETVQHGLCCNPQIVDASSVSNWVCDSCINDISELHISDET